MLHPVPSPIVSVNGFTPSWKRPKPSTMTWTLFSAPSRGRESIRCGKGQRRWWHDMAYDMTSRCGITSINGFANAQKPMDVAKSIRQMKRRASLWSLYSQIFAISRDHERLRVAIAELDGQDLEFHFAWKSPMTEKWNAPPRRWSDSRKESSKKIRWLYRHSYPDTPNFQVASLEFSWHNRTRVYYRAITCINMKAKICTSSLEGKLGS